MTQNTKKLAWLPDAIRGPLVALKNSYRQSRERRMQRRALKQALRDSPSGKIIVGASGTRFDGWISTNQAVLDLLAERDWAAYFEPDSLHAILAEHVWEHLTAEEAGVAATHCFRFLRPGGYLRMAVPDGFHPDPSYIEQVKPGGTGPGSDDHKVLYTYKSLSSLLEAAGFKIRMLEYFDENGEFHYSEWSPDDGMVRRSSRFDQRNTGKPLTYTSLIVDALKLP
jgi:predicted SAM-dependent methyltransferase